MGTSRFKCSFPICLMVASVLMALGAERCGAAEFPVTYQSIQKSSMVLRYRAKHAAFQLTEATTGDVAGLVGDGRTDNTGAFRALFSRPNVNVRIQSGVYVTGSFSIQSDTVVTLAPGVEIRDSGYKSSNEPFIQVIGNHVKIVGNGAKVMGNRDRAGNSVTRHGIYMIGVSDIEVDGLESSDAGGDGFYVGGGVGKPATNVTLVNCIARNNVRQGLSITNASHVDVITSMFTGTHGKPPEFGVDLEPNIQADRLESILLYGVRTESNRGGGIAIYLNPLKPSSASIDIEIVAPAFIGETTPFVTSTATPSVGGVVRYITFK